MYLCTYIFFTNFSLSRSTVKCSHPKHSSRLSSLRASSYIYLSMLLCRYIMCIPQCIPMAEISRDFRRTGPTLLFAKATWNTRGVNFDAGRFAEFPPRALNRARCAMMYREIEDPLHSRAARTPGFRGLRTRRHTRVCHLRDARKLHVSQIIEYRVSRRDIRLFDLPSDGRNAYDRDSPLNWNVRPAGCFAAIYMVCISRIFADNCAKGAFFRGAAKDNGARNDKIPGRSRVPPVLNSRVSLSLYAVERRPTRGLVFDLLRRSITIPRLVTDDIFLDAALRNMLHSRSRVPSSV